MLDGDFRVYLIEVNTNPCIETAQCPILQRIITDMVDSGFRIAVDPLFPPPSYTKRMNQTLPLTHWELVFDSDIDGPEIEKLLDKNSNPAPVSSNLSVIKE
jgi:tubulin--tyrosine ligase